MRYTVGGRSSANGAGEALATLWNPHGAIALLVVEFEAVSLGSGSGVIGGLQRATARGTPGSTITPDADSCYTQTAAPASGALLDLGDYSVNATLDASVLGALSGPGGANLAGSGIHLLFGMSSIPEIPDEGIRVPAGTGLAYVNTQALSAGVDVRFTWEE